MAHAVVFSPEANDDFRRLRAYERAMVRDAINVHLAHHPATESRTTIKRLRDLRRPQYRLRVGDMRVFYDVREGLVEVLGIVAKAQAADWLRERGEQP
jgi:mRNA-degrading endonuclease RelE of RelBE toxin-antitoxin system